MIQKEWCDLLDHAIETKTLIDPKSYSDELRVFMALEESMFCMYFAFLKHQSRCLDAKQTLLDQGLIPPELSTLGVLNFRTMTMQEPLKSKLYAYVDLMHPDFPLE